MTCIVGLVTKDGIYVGGDSAGVAGLSIAARADQKVFINNNFIFGFTSSFRMGQILHHAFSPPQILPNEDIHKFMSTRFVDSIRDAFKAGGYMTRHNDSDQGGTFLVGYKNHLFKIEDDFQVAENIYPYNAVGCGADIALGSLYTSIKSKAKLDKLNSRAVVNMALNAAQEFSAGVRAPFLIEFLKKS